MASLSGAWRKPPFPPLDISQTQLDEVAPLLNGSWAGALAWWRISGTRLRHSASADVLRQAHQFHSVQSIMHEETIKKVFRLLRQASIEPVVAKGWAAAALYPERPLRPYHDIDIYVKPEDFRVAHDLLSGPVANDCWVDLHKGFWELDDRSVNRVFDRSRLVSLGEEQIRVLGAEDHLALMAIHLLKHGARRPLWLCDIGAAIESLPESFDWNVCLGHNRTKANWIISAIGLAQRLLGARIDSMPRPREGDLPGWLLESVLTQWASPLTFNKFPAVHRAPMASYMRRPSGIIKAMKQRWPNPIAATVSVNGKFNGLPRLPYQVGNCVQRAGRFLLSAAANGF